MEISVNSNKLPLLFILLVVSNAITSVKAEVLYNAELSYSHDDNIARAQLDSDTFSDERSNLLLLIENFSDFDNGLSLTLGGDVEIARYQNWSGLNHADITVNANLRKKLGVGAFVPSIGSVMSFKRQDFNESVRDQDQWQIDFYWRKRLTETWDIKVDTGYFISQAANIQLAGPSGSDTGPGPGMEKPGDTFDQQAYFLGVDAGVAIGERYFLSFKYNFRSGDVASTAVPNVDIVAASTAITRDSVFGDAFFAYKLDATVHSLKIAGNVAINEQTSLTLSYEYQDSQTDRSISYQNNLSTLQLAYSF